MVSSLSMERPLRILKQVLVPFMCSLTHSQHSLVATQRYSSLSPVRRHHESGESALPVIHSLSPERVQSLNPSIGPSYLVNDDFSEVVPYIREDDAGTLIPPHDAPAERLPPAYHSSWVTRNARPSNSDPGEGSFAS